ncbi:methyltransferase domain-containing protein [bacterium]|nr:methyltransferase domain-containing protein [bacterium]
MEEFMARAGAFRESRVILVAVELGIFQTLAKGPLSAEGLARQLRLVPRAVTTVCNALVSLGWLKKKKGDAYSLPRGLRPLLDPDSPHTRVHGLLHTAYVFHSWAQLDAVARGQVDPGETRGKRRTRESNRNFILAMQELSPGREHEMAALLDLSDCSTLCDVGPGPGHYSVALAKKYPRMRFTLVDDPESLEVARDYVGRMPPAISSRFTYVPGDLLRKKKPDWGGPFDAILLSNVVHIFGEEENQAIVQRLAGMLSPRGVLIVRDFAINDEHTAPPVAALFAVNMLANTSRGGCYSERQVRAWMAGAGLSRCKTLDFPPSYLVLGYK